MPLAETNWLVQFEEMRVEDICAPLLFWDYGDVEPVVAGKQFATMAEQRNAGEV